MSQLRAEYRALVHEFDGVREQRDGLLAALKDYMANVGPNWQDKSCGHSHLCICPYRAARAAIAKAEGRQP